MLVVEGNLWEELKRVRNPRSLWGALISSVLDFGLNMFFTPDGKQTAQFLFTLGKGGRHTKRSEEHTSELQSLAYLVCRLLLEKKKKKPVVITRSHTYRYGLR